MLRPAMLLWKQAWFVELDTPRHRFAVHRTRIVQSSLAPIEDGLAFRSDGPAARAAFAGFLLPLLVTLLSAAWLLLRPLQAGLFTAFMVGLLIAGFVRRR